MSTDELYKALEELNKEKKEIIEGKNYKIGVAICQYLGDLFHLNFKHLIRNIKDKRAKNKIFKNYCTTKSSDALDVHFNKTCKDKNIAIYTCVVGEYDSIQIPLVTFDNVDYILYTDNPEKYLKYSDIYIIKKLPNDILKLGHILANRYVKFHPFELNIGYDYAIYLDGNVRVISDVRMFVEQCNCKTGIAMHRHRERNCVYQEAAVCKLLRRGNPQFIDQQIQLYRDQGFPENYGMNEATVIVSDLNNSVSHELLNAWWNEFVNSKSMRDQIAWPYVLWSNGYKSQDVGNLGYNIYANYKLEIVRHSKQGGPTVDENKKPIV